MDSGVESLATCGSLWDGSLAPKGRLQAPILQVLRLGGSDPGGVQAWRLGGLDWIGLIARLEVARWGRYSWHKRRNLTRSTLRELGG